MSGDVFCCFNRERDSYWGDPRSNGLYLATATGCRRLLYAAGKGYLRNDEPDVDSPEIAFENGLWSDYKITNEHCWCRIGNVHADNSFLVEGHEL